MHGYVHGQCAVTAKCDMRCCPCCWDCCYAMSVHYINMYIICQLRSILKKRNLNAHPPIRALKIPQDEREDVILSDLEYPCFEVARDPFKGALTACEIT